LHLFEPFHCGLSEFPEILAKSHPISRHCLLLKELPAVRDFSQTQQEAKPHPMGMANAVALIMQFCLA